MFFGFFTSRPQLQVQEDHHEDHRHHELDVLVTIAADRLLPEEHVERDGTAETEPEETCRSPRRDNRHEHHHRDENCWEGQQTQGNMSLRNHNEGSIIGSKWLSKRYRSGPVTGPARNPFCRTRPSGGVAQSDDPHDAEPDPEPDPEPGDLEPEEFDPESLGPPTPSIPDTSASAEDADPATARLFWALVLVFNVALMAVSLGAMFAVFRDQWQLGTQLFLGGSILFAYGYYRYRRFTTE